MATGAAGWARRYAVMLACSLVGSVVFWGTALAVDPDERDHVVGRSVATDVRLLGSDTGEACGDRNRQHAVRYQVVGSDDVRTTTVCVRRPPTEGLRTVWITRSGEVRFDSPSLERWSIAVLPLVVALLLTIGVPIARDRWRRHRGDPAS